MGIGVPSGPTENPEVKYQLLYDPAKQDYECFMTKTWTAEELDNWEKAGYRTQDGHYTEVGLYDSEEEMEEEKRRIMESRGPEM